MKRLGWLALLVLALLALGWVFVRGTAERPLDLGDRPGWATGRGLVGLRGDFAQCRALLDRAGVRFEALPPRHDGPSCGYGDAVRFAAGGSRSIVFAPANLGVACPVAAALAMWEWDVVQPAALRQFGRPVVRIEHFGSYNCRRIAGRDARFWSEHATAGAVDIAAFVLDDGRRVSIVNDWRGEDAASRFLRAARTGACGLFATVLSPDYNAAHRDHLHMDQAKRNWGRRACR